MDKIYLLAKANICDTDVDDAVKSNLQDVLSQSNSKVLSTKELENQPDLMKINAVLLSTGINKNDDVFLPEEILPARNTGAHKPINKGHDRDQIIGVMLRTFAATHDGKRISNDKEPLRANFDIQFDGVLYKLLFKEETKEIKQQAKAGELFVSVEAWFAAFDYWVGGKIIERTPDTAPILDKALKANGGDGFFENVKIGRVLRKVIIGGVGLVENPANPRSVIKSISHYPIRYCDFEFNDKTVTDNIIGDTEEIFCSVNWANEINNEEGLDMADSSDILQELKTVVAAIKAEFESTVSALKEEIKTLTETVEAFKQSEIDNEKRQTLASLGLNENEVEDHFTKCSRFKTKEDFEIYIEGLKALFDARLTQASETESETEETDTGTEDQEVDKADAEESDKAEDSEGTEETVDETENDQGGDVDKAEASDATDEETEEDSQDEQVDLENLDNAEAELDIETDGEKSLVAKMAEAVAFNLGKRNKKWKKLLK
jgi:hypothetical protein